MSACIKYQMKIRPYNTNTQTCNNQNKKTKQKQTKTTGNNNNKIYDTEHYGLFDNMHRIVVFHTINTKIECGRE